MDAFILEGLQQSSTMFVYKVLPFSLLHNDGNKGHNIEMGLEFVQLSWEVLKGNLETDRCMLY